MARTRNEELSQNSKQHTWYPLFRNISSSIVAGTTVASLTFPAESLKKWMQSNQETLDKNYQILKDAKITPQSLGSSWVNNFVTVKDAVCKSEYIPYRGLSVFVVNIVPTTIIQFMVEETLKKVMPSTPNLYQSVAASAFCGVVGAVNATFIENTIVRQQVMKAGPISTINDMFRNSIFRPWKSYPGIATRDGIFTLFMLNIIPNAVAIAKDNFGDWTAVPVRVAMSFAGAALSHPFDTVATLQQKSHEKAPFIDTAKKLYQEHGVKGFYRGVMCRTLMFGTFAYVLPKVRDLAAEKIDEVMTSKTSAPSMR